MCFRVYFYIDASQSFFGNLSLVVRSGTQVPECIISSVFRGIFVCVCVPEGGLCDAKNNCGP